MQSGNYSGSRIHVTPDPDHPTTTTPGSCVVTYSENASHDLYVGSRLLTSGATISVQVDGQQLAPIQLAMNGEDTLFRAKVGTFDAGAHTVTLSHLGGTSLFFFDFLEIAYPSPDLPDFGSQAQLSLATDWDTYHSQSLPAERTAWLIDKLGFHGTVNHYVGALWFYELIRPGTQYASLTFTVAQQSYTNSPSITLNIAAAPTDSDPTPAVTPIRHLALPDDTPATVAQALAGLINLGINLVWASASGNQLTITARAMGAAGNGITVQPDAASQPYISAAGVALTNGVDAAPYDLDPSDSLNATLTATADGWRTDLTAIPRINQAARDWHQAYFTALKSNALDCVAAFSTELMNGDPSAETGIAQRYPDNTAVVLNTPSIQTNFSPAAVAYWKQVYLDMAQLQANAQMTPYLQSGEVQWWYFPKQNGTAYVGMPFYDEYSRQQFQAQYGLPMQTITGFDPELWPESHFAPSASSIPE